MVFKHFSIDHLQSCLYSSVSVTPLSIVFSVISLFTVFSYIFIDRVQTYLYWPYSVISLFIVFSHFSIDRFHLHLYWSYGVATISRLLKFIRLFCTRALWKRRYSAKETYDIKEPTHRSHPIFSHISIDCFQGHLYWSYSMISLFIVFSHISIGLAIVSDIYCHWSGKRCHEKRWIERSLCKRWIRPRMD